MSTRDPVDMRFHEDAERDARRKVDEFGASLIYESKLVAFREHANEVQTPHVDVALENLNRSKDRGWRRGLTTLIGATVLGTSLDGAVTQYSANNAALLFTYAIIGFVAMTMIFLGLRD